MMIGKEKSITMMIHLKVIYKMIVSNRKIPLNKNMMNLKINFNTQMKMKNRKYNNSTIHFHNHQKGN